ncbi:hypothetical protein V9T40_001497 [Parthenolecanium corni]|uniref:Uncharacterized protein n=1 Tax=Parthenolecanium corni TaxID=536013 RepID=A0AAN9Y5H2_9HEMI
MSRQRVFSNSTMTQTIELRKWLELQERLRTVAMRYEEYVEDVPEVPREAKVMVKLLPIMAYFAKTYVRGKPGRGWRRAVRPRFLPDR